MKNALYTLGLFLFLEVATWAQPALNITSLSPPRQVVALGGSLTLSVTATGATSYQWQRNGLSVSGATAANFVVSNASPARDGGRYEVRVSNGGTNTFDSVLSPSVFVLVGSASTTRVAAWGDNSYGQTSVPTALDGVVAISAGQNHTVALKPSGTVVAWGYNGDGRIFKGATDVPRGLNDVVSVSAGGGYTLALKQDGTVVDWGEPNIGNRGENSLPTALGSQTDVAAVSAGAYHALGLTKAGGVFAWGNNTLGQCNIPTSVTASRIAAVAAGGASGGSLVLTNQGTLVKWPSYIGIAPMPAGLQNVVAIASGASFSLALKQDGTVVAWGYNDNGEISVPTGLNGVVAIAAGDYHALALKQDGRVVAWGYNRFGQCNVPPLGRVVAIAAGGNHSVAVYDSNSEILPAIPSNSLSNLSVRTSMATGQTLTLGAVVRGGVKNILVRAAGPALTFFGLSGVADPRVDLYTTAVTPIASNDNWSSSLVPTFTSVGAFAFASGSKDAALTQPLGGSFTAQAKATGPGVILVEAYDTEGGTSSRLINISARNHVGTGPDILIAGFAVNGTGSKQLLIRAVGPTLSAFGVSGTLADPTLKVVDSRGGTLVANDNWDVSLAPLFAQVGAFPLTVGGKDSALLVTLNAGSTYTVQVSGVNNGTGEALVEIYEVF